YDSAGICSGFYLRDYWDPSRYTPPERMEFNDFFADGERLNTYEPLCLEYLANPYYSENITGGEYSISGCLDGLDNDCDGVRDKEDIEDCGELDKDRDGYISDEYALTEYYETEWTPDVIRSRTVAGDDCNDLDAHINPGFSGCTNGIMEDGTVCLATEDYNCNGVAGETLDSDSDGIPDSFDKCNSNPGSNPYGSDGCEYISDGSGSNIPGWSS
ncbi:MAG: hypothetical protein V1729_04420, partial [Candidatus Woesearchaeota archaeon]